MKDSKNYTLNVIICILIVAIIAVFFAIINRKNISFEISIYENDMYIFDTKKYNQEGYLVSNDPDIAATTDDQIIGLKEGETSIYYVDSTTKENIVEFKLIVKNGVTDNIEEKGIQLETENNHEIEVGEINNIVYLVTPNYLEKNIVFASKNDSIVMVDSTGKLKGIKEGKTQVVVFINNDTRKEINVTVVKGSSDEKTESNAEIITKESLINIGLNDIYDIDYSLNNVTESLIFTSSNPKVAEVSDDGKITAKSIGITTIRISTVDKSVNKLVKVIVDYKTVMRIKEDSQQLIKGNTSTLTVQGLSKDEASKLSWTSSNKKIVTVDANGKIKGIAVGIATITAKTSNGESASCKITVISKNVVATSVKLNKTAISLKLRDTYQLVVTILPTNTTDKELTWTSSDSIVASVINGKVIALKEGTATISVKTTNGLLTTCSVNVTDKDVESTSVSLNKSSISLKIKDTYQLIATILPNDTTNKELKWISSNTSIVSVDSGKVTAVAVGTATITVKTNNGKTATCTITVTNPVVAVTGVTLDKNNISLYVGNEAKLNATISPTNATNKSLVWSSSDSNVVSVSSGTIKALKEGTATIKATTSDGNFEASASVTVKNSVKIHFIKQKTNSGDAILLESNGHYAMIDTGIAEDNQIVRDYLQSLNIHTLDFILITHNHYDHIGGGPYIINSGINVKKIYIKTYLCKDAGCGEAQTNRYNLFMTAAVTRDIPVTYVETLSEGYNFNFDQMNITLYNTVQRMSQSDYIGGNENNNSIVQYIKIGNTKTFLGADSYIDKLLTPIIKKVGSVDVVKIPHHAYKTCGVTDSSASILNAKYLIITNSEEVLGGSYVKCVKHFKKSIPRYFANDMNNSVIVDYSSGSVLVTKN